VSAGAASGVGSGVGRVYAEALFALAKEKGAVEAVGDDLAEVLTMLRDNPSFRLLIESPELSREETEGMIRETFGTQVGAPVLNLMLLLVRKRRQSALGRIAESYEAIRAAERNERRATISTAAPLDEATKSRIAETLARKLGGRIVLDETIDPAILGGVLLRVGDTLVDGTLRTGLERLARHMANPNHEKGSAS